MALIDWSESLSVGIPSIDDQHKKLVQMVNDLHEAMKNRKAAEVLGRVLDDLIRYTATHFSYEEKLMQQHAYPEFAVHQKAHAALVTQATAIQEKAKTGVAFLTMEVMNFLKSWLSDHIQGTDKKYTAYLTAKGVR